MVNADAVREDGFQSVCKPKKRSGSTRNRNKSSRDKNKKGSFGSRSWSKPTTTTVVAQKNDDEAIEDAATSMNLASGARQDAAEKIRDIVSEEIENAEKHGQHGGESEALTAAIASSAVVSLVAASLPGFAQDVIDADPQDHIDPEISEGQESTDLESFTQKPLSSLLAEYGEQDPSWNQVEPQMDSKQSQPSSSPIPDSCLGQHGKAPIHVEFVSFGYHHGGAPSELRNGWSHAQPLSPFDTRGFPTVPHYLAWQDGLSGAVKRELFKANIQEFANDIAQQVSKALVEAIEHAGHGYALPLHMTIYVSSEAGRHRSVVVSELAATALRKLLRANEGDRFGRQPCSVGTRHRDIERRRRRTTAARDNNTGSKPNKQMELEEGW